MPTIPQLPAATSTGTSDELPISQGGVTRSVSVSELLGGLQTAITLPSQTLLGRVSLGPGGPEVVPVGLGVALQNATLVATAQDHLQLPAVSTIGAGDEVVVNASGVPSRLPTANLRSLFSAGNNVSINGGSISAGTDPSVTGSLSTLAQGLATAQSNLATLAAKVPSGGYVSLNSQGQVTAPIAGSVSAGTVMVEPGLPARTLANRALDTLNVLDFGAVPGGVDCMGAFNNAFTVLPTTGGEIFIPAGDYWFNSPLVWSGKPFTLRGAGKGITRLHFQHTGIGLDISQSSGFNRVNLIGFSAFAESTAGATAAVARLTYPAQQAFGYVTCYISDIECFGYPGTNNGTAPFPQTFNRGFILLNGKNTQINNVSWFGPPAAAGTTTSALIEINGSVDTRISGVEAYFGSAVVLQTGYCEGVYFENPLVVGADYLFAQQDITSWPTYAAGKNQLLGLWAANGEVNTTLGTVLVSNMAGGFFVGLDLSREGGPNTSQTFFQFTDVSNFLILGCNFVGGPPGGNTQDVAISFTSVVNSSGNTVGGCAFQDMATILKINGQNGTVGLNAFGLNPGNVPISTAVIDNSVSSVSNYISFLVPGTASLPAGLASTKDQVWCGADGSPSFRVSGNKAATNYLHAAAAGSGGVPSLVFDGADAAVAGQIATKGGNLFFSAGGGGTSGGNMLGLLNNTGATSCVQISNAVVNSSCQISTSAGGLTVNPKGSLVLSPTGGVFAPSLPTVRPTAGSGQLWNNNGVLSVA